MEYIVQKDTLEDEKVKTVVKLCDSNPHDILTTPLASFFHKVGNHVNPSLSVSLSL